MIRSIEEMEGASVELADDDRSDIRVLYSLDTDFTFRIRSARSIAMPCLFYETFWAMDGFNGGQEEADG